MSWRERVARRLFPEVFEDKKSLMRENNFLWGKVESYAERLAAAIGVKP